MNCHKCLGLMTSEHTWEGGIHVELMRCINCGERLDELIADNRLTPPKPHRKGAHINGRSEVLPKVCLISTPAGISA